MLLCFFLVFFHNLFQWSTTVIFVAALEHIWFAQNALSHRSRDNNVTDNDLLDLTNRLAPLDRKVRITTIFVSFHDSFRVNLSLQCLVTLICSHVGWAAVCPINQIVFVCTDRQIQYIELLDRQNFEPSFALSPSNLQFAWITVQNDFWFPKSGAPSDRAELFNRTAGITSRGLYNQPLSDTLVPSGYSGRVIPDHGELCRQNYIRAWCLQLESHNLNPS